MYCAAPLCGPRLCPRLYRTCPNYKIVAWSLRKEGVGISTKLFTLFAICARILFGYLQNEALQKRCCNGRSYLEEKESIGPCQETYLSEDLFFCQLIIIHSGVTPHSGKNKWVGAIR
jgi:hypothetical protein